MSSVVIAKIENDENEYQRLLGSEDDIFIAPITLDSAREYDPKTILESDEWFKITNFSEKKYCLNLFKQTFDSVDFSDFKNDNFGKIEYIFSFQDNVYYFQRVTSAKQIRQKLIELGDSFEFTESLDKVPKGFAKLTNRASIYLKAFPDAIYHTIDNALYFRSLKDISKIFIGIDELYREATENEVANFLGRNFIKLSEGFSSDNVKAQNRKRIVPALEIMNKLSVGENNNMFSYIGQYCPQLEKIDDKFVINSEQSLKDLLYGIDQRYYTTPIGGECRLANSVILLNK